MQRIDFLAGRALPAALCFSTIFLKIEKSFLMVGEEGLEPSLHCWNQILSLARLPIPPLAQTYTAIAEITLVLYNKRQ